MLLRLMGRACRFAAFYAPTSENPRAVMFIDIDLFRVCIQPHTEHEIHIRDLILYPKGITFSLPCA